MSFRLTYRAASPKVYLVHKKSNLLQRPSHSMATATEPLRNVLAQSKSPYLLQHKDNPVAWQEFSPQTIALAKQLDKPIFLSSGYSACHWCHVLAHESFEDEGIAKIMNEYFVNIKVDREERPDVDRMYMTFLQATSGGGGWPMSICECSVMTPNLEPFFAGTYFPRARFQSVLMKIADLWEDDRTKCEEMGKNVIEQLKDMGGTSSRLSGSLAQVLSTHPGQKVFNNLCQTHDPRYGGFSPGGPRSTGPKFPSCSMTLDPLARIAAYPPAAASSDGSSHDVGVNDRMEVARQMGVKVIRAIWNGGIRDWVGGGVARYSVDEKWIVPHFEKMLYDQAQLASAAIDFALICSPNQPDDEAEQQGELDRDQRVCFDLAADIIEYTLRDLLSPKGAFYSAEDADSARRETEKKSEGAFYIWSKQEFDEVVGPEDAAIVGWFFGVKLDGNVEPKHDMHGEMTGMNILSMVRTYESTGAKFGLDPKEIEAKVKAACQRLKARRDEDRPRPGLDDKILCGWNGLMITALAKAAQSLPASYTVASQALDAAKRAVAFIKTNMWDPETHTLYRSWREGRGPMGQTDDYAFLIRGLLDLYEASGDESYALFAIELQERQDELFWDEEGGGYFASAPDEHVLVRMKDAQDAAEPSALSVSAHNNSRLSLLCADEYEAYEKRAEDTYLSIGAELQQIPRAFGYSVCGLMDLEQGYREYIISGRPSETKTQDLLKVSRQNYAPSKVVIQLDPDHPPTGLVKVNSVIGSLCDVIKKEEPSLRICEGATCHLPIFDIEAARQAVLA